MPCRRSWIGEGGDEVLCQTVLENEDNGYDAKSPSLVDEERYGFHFSSKNSSETSSLRPFRAGEDEFFSTLWRL